MYIEIILWLVISIYPFIYYFVNHSAINWSWFVTLWMSRYASVGHSCHDKNLVKAPCRWPLWGEFTVDQGIPHTKGQYRGKCFHLMISSCVCLKHAYNNTWGDCYKSVSLWWPRNSNLQMRRHFLGALYQLQIWLKKKLKSLDSTMRWFR